MTGGIDVKGWCPGARRPMQSGDGLIVRVRPHGGSLPVAALAALADAAARFGNGEIDLTRRANLQLRGMRPEALENVWSVLSALELLDDDAEAEAVRNIAINPLAGLDPSEIIDLRPVARALERQLAADVLLRRLPGKFGVLLDGGGLLPLRELEADIHLVACRNGADAAVAIGLQRSIGIEWLGATVVDHASARVIQLAHAILRHSPNGRARTLLPDAVAAIRAELGLWALNDAARVASETASPRHGLITLGGESYALGLGAAFGRLDGATLSALANELSRSGIPDVRLSPWRTLYVAPANRLDADRLTAFASANGLIVSDTDPLTLIDACSGVGCCASTSLATREHARALAAIAARVGFTGTLHVSGCAKGCARSAAADLVLIGDGDNYRIVRRGTVRDDPFAGLDAAEITTAAPALLAQEQGAHV